MHTLGEVLYAGCTAPLAPETEWEDLVRRTAAGELAALHGLYERAARLVYVLALRITSSRSAADDVTVEVFMDVWRRAWAYHPADGSVLAWIMNQARTCAQEHARYKTLARNADVPTGPESSDGLAPRPSLQSRLARRLADHESTEPTPPSPSEWNEPAWARVGEGISCKILASDEARRRVSMMVRLAPASLYPPHRHAGLEELHLLDGVLLIDDKVVHPGGYNRAEADSSDTRVWSDTGCTCVLVTSTADELL